MAEANEGDQQVHAVAAHVNGCSDSNVGLAPCSWRVGRGGA
jgi:hypothetical protein